MIDALRVAKTAHFYSLKRPLSNASVDELFRRVRAGHPSASQNVFFHRRSQVGASFWSAICFFYDRTPSFLSEDADIRERICGFILLVEHRDHVAFFKSKLEVPAGFSTRYLGKISSEKIDLVVARKDSIFEKIRLRNMSISKHVMRSKSFEADDLSNVVGPAGVNRYVPQGYTVRSDTGNYSTTPSTGRIGQRSDRVGHLALVEYAATVIDNIVGANGTPARFIGSFARAIDLASVQGNLRPTSFAIDVASLVDAVLERREVRFVRKVIRIGSALSPTDVLRGRDEDDRAL